VARKARVEYEGAVYHVLDCGDRREAIFQDDGDRRRFLETLGEACGRTGWRVHAYVLMSNHYHLMIETPQANLVAGDALVPDDVDDPVQPASPAERAPFCLSFPKRRANFGNESENTRNSTRKIWIARCADIFGTEPQRVLSVDLSKWALANPRWAGRVVAVLLACANKPQPSDFSLPRSLHELYLFSKRHRGRIWTLTSPTP
jgi:hypothetical protein